MKRSWVIALAVAGAALVVVGVQRAWGHGLLDQPAPLPDVRVVVAGGDLAAGARTLALVTWAAVAAALALGGRSRRAVGAVVLVCGLGIVGQVLLQGSADAVRDHLVSGRDPGAVTAVSRTPWPGVVLAGGAVISASGMGIVLVGHRWGGLSQAYRPPAARQPDPLTDKGVWDALDRGEDPTG